MKLSIQKLAGQAILWVIAAVAMSIMLGTVAHGVFVPIIIVIIFVAVVASLLQIRRIYVLYKKVKRIKQSGRTYQGVVVDYITEKDTTKIAQNKDGIMINLVVRYQVFSGQVRECIVSTGHSMTRVKYPVGTCVKFILSEEEKEALFEDIVEEELPNKQFLLSSEPDSGHAVHVKKLTPYKCMHCGNIVVIDKTGYPTCTYCGSPIAIK